VQNENMELSGPQPEPSPEVKGLKGKLKAAFSKKSLKGFAKAAFNNFKHELKNRKLEMLTGILTSGIIKGGAVTLCSASLLGSASGVILVGTLTGGTVAAAKYGISYWKADEEERKNFSLKKLGAKIAWGAGFGILGNTVGSYVAHHLHCFGGKFFSKDDMFITAHKGILPDGQATQPVASILQKTPPVAVSPVVPVAAAPEIATPPAPLTADTPSVSALPTPAPVVPVSPLDAIRDYAAHNNISAKLKEALSRADSTNVRVRAQALDDIAVYAPKDLRMQAYELLKKSAGMGNLKAKADMITMEFYGSKALGIKANPEAAIDKMVALSKHSKFAAKLVDQWVGNPSGPVAVPAIEHITTPPTQIPDLPAISTDTIDAPTTAIPVESPVTAPVIVENIPPVVHASQINPDCFVTLDPSNIANRIINCDANAEHIDLNVGDKVKLPSFLGRQPH
jgi:hypothetical protein